MFVEHGGPQLIVKTTVIASLEAQILVKSLELASVDHQIIVKGIVSAFLQTYVTLEIKVFAFIDPQFIAKTTVSVSLEARTVVKSNAGCIPRCADHYANDGNCVTPGSNHASTMVFASSNSLNVQIIVQAIA